METLSKTCQKYKVMFTLNVKAHLTNENIFNMVDFPEI